MGSVPSRRRRAVAVPLSLAAAAALAVVPSAASALPLDDATASASGATAQADGPELSYVVNTARHGSTKAVKRAIAKAGGTIVVAHDKIGVIVVHSANPEFAETIREAAGVQSAGATRTSPLAPVATTDVGATVKLDAGEARRAAAEARRTAAADEPLEALQWDLPAIKADQAHTRSQGSRKVTVGVIDTGVDDTHPDLAPNFDRAASANCVGGVADSSDGAWRPYPDGSDHGTHVAGTIAAPRNGIGVSGVAPGVKVAGIKVSEPGTSLFFTEAVVCGFVWAADHGIDVTNNSYYVDPWMFNCKDDPDQKALLDALRRATDYAERKGAVNVAAAGNENSDLAADSITDESSPNDSTPVSRVIDPSECLDIPTQLPGVVTVSATGAKNAKSYYSNYGLGQVDVAAPGGDARVVPDAPAVNGRILSTVLNGQYGYKQGTSMASPHVAGVLALLKSTHPKAPPAALKAMLKIQADNPGCPAGGTEPTTCEGGKHYNGYFGHGIVDALDAVKKR